MPIKDHEENGDAGHTTADRYTVTSNRCLVTANANVWGNVMLDLSGKGNYFKRTAINDSQFVYSCGRGPLEYIVDTYKCTDKALPEVKFENDELIVLTESGGTYVWKDIFIPLRQGDSVRQVQSIYIDTTQLRYVNLIRENGDILFHVHGLRFGEDIVLRSKYSRLISGAIPEEKIRVESCNDSLLYYSVRINGALISDSLRLNWE